MQHMSGRTAYSPHFSSKEYCKLPIPERQINVKQGPDSPDYQPSSPLDRRRLAQASPSTESSALPNGLLFSFRTGSLICLPGKPTVSNQMCTTKLPDILPLPHCSESGSQFLHPPCPRPPSDFLPPPHGPFCCSRCRLPEHVTFWRLGHWWV